MTEQTPTKQTALFDGDDERFLISSKYAINHVLMDLAKRPEIITAYFNHGKDYILTAVLGTIPDRNLLVLDYGADEIKNKRLLEQGRTVCVTKHDSIDIKFSCSVLKKAKFQNREAFAASFPETLYRRQRREFFRVTLPHMQPIKCRIEHPVDGTALLTVADLSAGGLCLLDASQQLDPAPGTVLEECLLLLPEQATLSMDLTVRNSFLVTQNDGSQARRIGCAFKALSADKSAILQRFIHRIQVEQLAKSDV